MFKVLHSYYFADTYPDEWAAMETVFSPGQLITETSEIQPGDIVLPRYRTVPFGDILEAEVVERGGRLINSFQESARVRDLFQWVDRLGEMTAAAYTLDTFAGAPECGYFVKGQTSSLKNRGPASAFALDKVGAMALAKELAADDWLSSETIALRPLQDYMRLGTTKTGLPIFNERRVFTYSGNVLAEGFYWQSFMEHLTRPIPLIDGVYWSFVQEAVERVRDVAPFVVIDMAQYADGHWGVVELNDGCQAGFSGASELGVYAGLNKLVK